MKKTISGIRGIVGEDFTLKDVIEFCNNFSSMIPSKKIVIGNDTRPSSNMIKETSLAAFLQNGIDVYNLGMVPTPVVFREARRYGAGLVVTSSHNPLEWNGLKFIIQGRGVNQRELPIILEKQTRNPSNIGSEHAISSKYVEEAAGLIGKIDFPPNIAVDIGGGAARDFAPPLLENLGCNVDVINPDVKGSSRGPDPTADPLADLLSLTDNKDIGFAFDLDGDRLVVVKNGKKQTPDVTLGLGVAKAINLGYKDFVFSIDTSIAVEKFVKERGGSVKRSKVGEANVIDLMLAENAQAGGEGSSGGFILPEFNYCREGILTSGLIASMIKDPSFDEVLEFMESFHQVRDKVKIDSQYHDSVISKFQKDHTKQYSEVDTIDGFKGIIDENSWVLIRKSNTEDIIRVSAESNDSEKCKKIVANTLSLVEQCYDKVR